jgi:hypothetical protein
VPIDRSSWCLYPILVQSLQFRRNHKQVGTAARFSFRRSLENPADSQKPSDGALHHERTSNMICVLSLSLSLSITTYDNAVASTRQTNVHDTGLWSLPRSEVLAAR